MAKFKNWKDVKKEIESNLTPEELEEIELEKEIIRTTSYTSSGFLNFLFILMRLLKQLIYKLIKFAYLLL